MSENEPCDEYVDLGPFRFECVGHLPGAGRRSIDYHGGRHYHVSSSCRDEGDVEVRWFTLVAAPTKDELGRE